PGDTVILLGAYAAVRGDAPASAVFLVVTVGSLAGSAVCYGGGRFLAARGPPGGRLGLLLERVFSPALMARLAVRYRRHGRWFILANRFLPGARAIFFVFAGMSGVPFSQTLVLGGISAALWNAMLMGVGWSVG